MHVCCHNNGRCADGICFCNSEYTGTYCNITAQPKCTGSQEYVKHLYYIFVN